MICALLSNTYSLLLRVFAQIKSLTHDLPDTDDHMLKARYLLYISTPLVVPLPPSAPYMHIEREEKGRQRDRYCGCLCSRRCCMSLCSECWCVTLQHCPTYPANLFFSFCSFCKISPFVPFFSSITSFLTQFPQSPQPFTTTLDHLLASLLLRALEKLFVFPSVRLPPFFSLYLLFTHSSQNGWVLISQSD